MKWLTGLTPHAGHKLQGQKLRLNVKSIIQLRLGGIRSFDHSIYLFRVEEFSSDVCFVICICLKKIFFHWPLAKSLNQGSTAGGRSGVTHPDRGARSAATWIPGGQPPQGLSNVMIYISGIWLWYMQALSNNRVKQNRCLKSENPQPTVVTILPPCSGKQMWMWCSVVSSLLDGS